MAKQLSIEESFEQLDEIIANLEKGELSLEKSFQLYNDGVKLIKNCNTQLEKVEKQIIILNENEADDEF